MTLRVLLASDAPWAASGYAVETRLAAPRLAKFCDLALLTTYGLHGARMTWNPDTNELQQSGGSGVPVYPGGADPFANDAIGQSARDWKADIIITLKDSFVFRPEAFQGFRWMPMVPVDHEPIPPSVVQVCRHAYRPIAYAPNGFRELRAAGFDPCFAPHAYDPDIFYPMPRAEARKSLGLPDDIFIVGTVAVNRGGIPSRKAWPQNLEAFAQFRKHHEDAFYLIHTNVADDGFEGGIPLRPYAAQLGILDRLIAPEPERYKAGFPDDYMRALYNSLDVLNAVSLGEGFGIPQLEAQACGVPVITSDFAAARDLCFAGWKVSDARGDCLKFYDGQASYVFLPDPAAIAERLEDAYCYYNCAYEEGKRPDLHAQALAGAAPYQIDRVIAEYWKPLLEEVERDIRSETSRGVLRIVRREEVFA